MKNPLISVIVPVYNVENFLPRCINSILSQTFTDFELLLIDDGSTDKSGEICDEYAQNDMRIKVFHKQNEGVSAARNLGIDKACGEWIIFMDSDDYFLNNAFNLFIDSTNRYDVHIVVSNFFIEKGHKRKKYSRHGKTGIVHNVYFGMYFNIIQLRAGASLYSSKILKECYFDVSLSRFEDAKHIYEITRNHKIAYINSCVMVYSLDKEGGLHNKLNDPSQDFIFNIDFSGKSFWEKMLLSNLVYSGFFTYPECKIELKEKYRKYYLYLIIDKLLSFLRIKKIIRFIGFC